VSSSSLVVTHIISEGEGRFPVTHANDVCLWHQGLERTRIKRAFLFTFYSVNVFLVSDLLWNEQILELTSTGSMGFTIDVVDSLTQSCHLLRSKREKTWSVKSGRTIKENDSRDKKTKKRVRQQILGFFYRFLATSLVSQSHSTSFTRNVLDLKEKSRMRVQEEVK